MVVPRAAEFSLQSSNFSEAVLVTSRQTSASFFFTALAVFAASQAGKWLTGVARKTMKNTKTYFL